MGLGSILNRLSFGWTRDTPIERVTCGVPVIDTNHGQIHASNAFSMIGTLTVAQSKVGVIQIAVPEGVYVHLQALDFSSNGGAASVTLIEDAHLTSEVGASALTPNNHHRISKTASELVIKALADAGVTNGSAPVTLAVLPLHSTATGSVKITNESGSPNEWVLEPGATYVLAFSHSVAGNCVFGYNVFWYEEGGA